MADTITIHGNVGADPETRELQSGAVVTNVRVGSTHRKHDRQTGEWRDTHTNWFSVSAWDSLASAAQKLRKGDPVTIIGTLKLNQWETENGRGATLEVRADEIAYDLRRGRRTLGDAAPELQRAPRDEPAADAWSPAPGLVGADSTPY